MSISVVAIDYSRPVQAIFEQPLRAGKIHSVFRRVVNIAVDGTMLSLLSNELPRMPHGVRLPSVMVEEMLQGLRPGMEVRVGEGRLIVPDYDFSLSLSERPAWEPRPDVERCCWEREVVAEHVRLLVDYMKGRNEKGGLAGLVRPLVLESMRASALLMCSQHIWRKRFRVAMHAPRGVPRNTRVPSQHIPTPAPTGHRSALVQEWETTLEGMALPKLRLLARASWRQDMAGIEEATRGLAGLGPGLTPAGDDMLAGFAALMTLLSSRLSADGVFRGQVAEVIARVAMSRTTMLSGVLLGYAARGEVAEQVGNLLLALALPAGESEAVLRAADDLLAFGATSGGDTLLGVLLGLKTLEGEIDDNGVFM